MKIAIIGAGITGSLLASKLASGGHHPLIFEKSRGRGGRCTFKRTDWAEFDLGAPVVPAWDEDFIGFMHTQVDNGLAISWPQQVFEFDTQLAPSTNKRQQFLFTGGMNSVCIKHLQYLQLSSECAIEQATKTAGKWWLTDSVSRCHGPFDCVVLTAPWPQTRQLLKHIDRDNYFTSPSMPLPEQDWSSCWTVALQLAVPIETNAQLIYLKNSAVQTLIQDSAKPGRKTGAKQLWLAHLNHDLSAQLGSGGGAEAVALAKQSLQQVFPAADLRCAHHYANHYSHYWCYARPAPQQGAIGLIVDKQSRFLAGGDWSFGASIQAAYQAATALYGEILSLS